MKPYIPIKLHMLVTSKIISTWHRHLITENIKEKETLTQNNCQIKIIKNVKDRIAQIFNIQKLSF